MNALTRAIRLTSLSSPIRQASAISQRNYATTKEDSAKAHPPRRTFLHNKYKTILNNNRIALILQFNNLNVKELTAIRQELNQLSFPATLTIVRSGIFSSVLRDTRFANLDPIVTGPICVLHTNGSDVEHPTLVKDVVGILNKNKKLLLIGGKMDETLLNFEDIEKVRNIAGISSVQSELLGVLQSPARQLLSLLDRRPQELVMALEQHSKNLGDPEAAKPESS
ncbi:hypothetical protein INT43_004703 [Umbelopsis isabellina]|uniref:Ribosomal protein L10 n=1 Tax=Mortierella isabellina TaxID=91625 RepID=A0A8H7PGQ2_MORIS|nr:hypothetical protein INT43_004703 [Umbelopsis isabellina]